MKLKWSFNEDTFINLMNYNDEEDLPQKIAEFVLSNLFSNKKATNMQKEDFI